MAQPLHGHNVRPPRPPVHPPPHIARPSSKDKRSTTAQEKVEHYLSSQQQQLQPHSVPPSYVSTEAATTTTSFAQLQHLPQGPNPEVGEVSITMTDELPTVTAFSKVKTKLAQECYNDNDTDSSVSDSDAPTVEHFNISFLFKKTFREHKGANAIPYARVKLHRLYGCTLMVTYNCCLFTFGFLLAFIWGICNGVVAFLQAWIISPLLRVSLIVVKGTMPIILDPLSLLLKACVAACRGAGGLGTAGLGEVAGVMQSVGGALSGAVSGAVSGR